MTPAARTALDQIATYGEGCVHPLPLAELIGLGLVEEVRPYVGRITPAGLLVSSGCAS